MDDLFDKSSKSFENIALNFCLIVSSSKKKKVNLIRDERFKN